MKRKRALALLLAVCLLLSACGGGAEEAGEEETEKVEKIEEAKAATMHLRRTEGETLVHDEKAEEVPLLENLGLFSGYQVDTRTESYAWIDLDAVKLTKMDEESRVEIQKEGKDLKIRLTAGSLFFRVTEPLEEDETMEIRTADLLVGIRGTCGWVDAERKQVALLEGEVLCEAEGGETAPVSAGEKAELDGEGAWVVTPLTEEEVPAFVLTELDGDGDLLAALPEPEPPVPRDRDGDSYTRLMHYGPDGNLVEYRVISFDELGRMIRADWYTGNETQARYEGYFVFTYGEDGQLAECQFYESDDTPGLHAVYEDTDACRTTWYDDGLSKEISYYDEQGQKSRFECYYGDYGCIGYYLFEYNDRGLLDKAMVYQADGTLDSYILYLYD